MINIVASCNECNERYERVQPMQVTVIELEPPNKRLAYSFKCSAGHVRIKHITDRAVAEQLILAGCVAVSWDAETRDPRRDSRAPLPDPDSIQTWLEFGPPMALWARVRGNDL